ncbi:MAG: hypothetical protein IAE85_17715 [Anaerolinea sp.]|nr:hypothetical protein [Anaerolinea sp.]
MSTTGITTEVHQSVVREFVLSVEQVHRLRKMADSRDMSESRVVEKALELLFGMDDSLDLDLDRETLYRLSEPSLLRIWDNDSDAVYDNWRDIYGLPEG